MQDLFKKYLLNQCAPEEVEKILGYFDVAENELSLRALIAESLEDVDAGYEEVKWTPSLDETFASIKKELNNKKGKLIPLKKRTWSWGAAAVVFLLVGLAAYDLIKSPGHQQSIANGAIPKQKDAPGSNKAVLTLADGSAIRLGTATNGTITQQGQARISKPVDGQLVYTALNEKPNPVLFNTIATPRGGQYELVLSDGSKVWLNAASSLRFPVTFSGKERRVALTGEAYFEVAKNASMPFKVMVDGKTELEVLGTHFNVNAYDDEATVKTALLEGQVKVVGLATGNASIIVPGEQARLNNNGQISIDKNIDTEQAIAWKNGAFNFSNADLGMVLRQLSRWYDVDVVIEGRLPERQFNGEIQHDLKLTQVLKLLEKNGVYSRLEGKKLIVLQHP